MKLPLSWLNDYVDITGITPQELSDKLLSIGFEVEEIILPRTNIKNVVVGKVNSIVRHDNSDKLWICQIDIGKEIVQIVTGAQNVSQGDLVPVALVGAELPDGKTLSAAKLRGVDSFGMLCSGAELDVTDDIVEGASVDGILILPNDFTIGENILSALGLNDTILDVSITANRPDCQAIVNLAREISILLNRPFRMPKMTFSVSNDCDNVALPNVNILNKELCSRYIGRCVCDVKIERSPKWMRDRLRMCDIRPINNLVDITNYVLLEFGQPMHAFDSKYIDGNICIRLGGSEEKIVALDEKEYSVENILIISDDKKPLAIAGIMGGEYTSIFDDTKNVFLESARFERSNIRRSSKKIGLRSDSSARFEKGVDWQSVELGSQRALALIDQLGCGKISNNIVTDAIPTPQQKIIRTTQQEICSLLGIDIDKKTIVSILKKQNIDVKCEGKTLICTIPLIREDVDGYPDLAEDVMRFYGYDNIVSTHSENTRQTTGGLNTHDTNVEILKNRLVALGIDEILNYSFISPDADQTIFTSAINPIVIQNPLSRDISVMRTQLVTGMLSSISRNCARKNNSMSFFELGNVFMADKIPLDTLPDERDVLCIGLCNNGDFYDIKAIVCDLLKLFDIELSFTPSDAPYLHPKQSLAVKSDLINGDFGKLHPLVCENYDLPSETYIAHLDIANLLKLPIKNIVYRPISKLQPVDRDLALIVDNNIPVGDMLNAVAKSNKYITDVKLFDIYVGEQIPNGCKSVAFSVRLQPEAATFSDSEIKNIMGEILEITQKSFGAKLR